MFRPLILAFLVVATSLGVLEFSARTDTAGDFAFDAFRAERLQPQAELSTRNSLLPAIAE